MFDISFTELMVIGVVALIVIGPERLPKVARTVGHLLGRAQRYVNEVKTDIQREINLDEVKDLKKQMEDAAQSVRSSVEDTTSSLRDPLAEARDMLNDATQSAEQAFNSSKQSLAAQSSSDTLGSDLEPRIAPDTPDSQPATEDTPSSSGIEDSKKTPAVNTATDEK